MRTIIIISLLLSLRSALHAESGINFNDEFTSRYFKHLYNFEFNDVNAMLDSISPGHKLENHLYKANYYFWRNISGDSSADYFTKCKQELNNQIILLKQSKLTKIQNVFYNSLAYSYLMRLELNRGNYLNGMKMLDNSINYFEKALDNKYNNEEFVFLSGMYNYFKAYASEKYPVSKIYLNLYKSGNRTKGIQQLKKCKESKNMIIRTESTYFLLKIYLNLEKDYKAAKSEALELLKLYPNNIVFHREYYLVLINMGLKIEAKKEKDNIISLLNQNVQLNNFQRNYYKKTLN